MNFVTQFDLVFYSETWQKHNDKFDIEGYNCISVPRPENLRLKAEGIDGMGGGGICLFINDSVADGIEIIERNSSGLLRVKMSKQFFGLSCDLYACFCYIPPKESVCFKKVDIDFYYVLENGIRKYADLGKIAVLGDLNPFGFY